jgi:4'-phosphopantetheinyl transferase
MSGAQDAHLWRVDPRSLADDAVRERCLALLSPAERARHDRLAVPARRLELAAAHALVRIALEQFTATPAAEWRVRRDSMGRPLVEGPVEGMRVSITHTPGLVACLVAKDRDVGVDGEQVSPRVPYMRIAEQVFTPGELAQLKALDDQARIDRFFLLWSVKEAFGKARGEGLAAPLDKVEVQLEASGAVRLIVPPGTPPEKAGWKVRWTRPSEEHVMATCVACRAGEDVGLVEHVGLP